MAAGWSEPVTTACTSWVLICCHLVVRTGRVRSAGRFFTLVASLKCSRNRGNWFESEVGRLLVMTNEWTTGVADEAWRVGTIMAPRTPTARAMAKVNRLVTDTQYRR